MLKKIAQWLLNILIGVDQLANAICGGHPDETISSRLGRNWPNSFLAKFIDWLFWKGHCKQLAEKGDSGQEILKVVVFLFLCTNAMAFEEPAFKNEPYRYNEYRASMVNVDRYDERKLRNDPEVLVSAPVKATAYFYHETQLVEVHEKVEDKDIIVTAQLCDDTSCMDLPTEVK